MSSRRLSPVDGSGELDRLNMSCPLSEITSQQEPVQWEASAVGASTVVANIDGFYAWLVPVKAGQFGRMSVLNRQRDTTGLRIVAGGIDDHQLNGVDAIGEACTVEIA